jgi:hypothetical protein
LIHLISEYFRDKSLLFLDDDPPIHVLTEINEDLPSVDLFVDPIDVDMMSFLIDQTNHQQINHNRR